MSSITTALSIGLSAIQSGQTDLEVVGQNLSNANTTGYLQENVNYITTNSGSTGTGVDIASISQITDAPAQTAIFQGNGQQNSTSTLLGIAQQIQTILTAGGTSTSTANSSNGNAGTNNSNIGSTITSFFDQLAELTSDPSDSSVASTIVGQASLLASQFNSASTALGQLSSNVQTQISQTVSQVNTLTGQIATLNGQIANMDASGGNADSLIDQQNQAINQLSQLVDVQTVSQPEGEVNVLSSGGPLVLADQSISYQAGMNASGQMAVTQSGTNLPANFSSGTLGGLLEAYNQQIPSVSSQLDTLANSLSSAVNEIQATGIGKSGSLTSTTGTVAVADPTAPLSTQNLSSPIQAGQLVISVINAATGTSSNDAIAIDPSSMSLNDVANAIASGTGGEVQATVTQNNTIQLNAQSGYSFNFAGQDTNPPSGSGVSNPDTAGVLAGLGINGLFSGSGAANISVNPAIAANPNLLATSQTGEPGDTSNLQRMANLQTQSLVNGQTLSEDFTSIATTVGTSVQQMTDQQTSQTGLLQSLNDQDQSVTGVDQNQELVKMVNAQQLISAASQFMAVVNNTLTSLINIIQPGG